MNWKIGQKLVSLIDNDSPARSNTPKKGEIVTFDGMDSRPGLHGYCFMREYKEEIPVYGRFSVHISTVRPLIEPEAKSELVSSFTEVTETSDLPIRSPQPVPSSCGS